MATIVDCRLDWREGWANSPGLEVLVDSLAAPLRYEERDGTYLAIDGDVAHFLYWNGRGNSGGYAGREIPVTMVDGSIRILRGPWSNNSDNVNEAFPETPVTEALVTADVEAYARGHTFFAEAVPIASLARLGEIDLVRREDTRIERATTARIAKLADGTYAFVIDDGHGWETKDDWLARMGRNNARPSAQIAELI